MIKGQLRQTIERGDWLFDFFAHGYDFAAIHINPEVEGDASADWADETRRAKSVGIEQQIIDADGSIPSGLRSYLNLPDDSQMTERPFLLRLLCLLQAIDSASAGFSYFAPFREPGTWPVVRTVLSKGPHNLTREAGGFVLCKPSRLFPLESGVWWREIKDAGTWTDIPERGLHHARRFVNLCRVPEPDGYELEVRVLTDAEDLRPTDWSRVRVAFAPMLERLGVSGTVAFLHPGPLQLFKNRERRFTISISPPDPPDVACEPLSTSAEAVLRFAAQQNAQIVAFPELAVPDPVLQRIKRVLLDLSRTGSRSPQLVFAGTFLRAHSSSQTGLPYNEAVILNGRGDELWRQRKLHPYAMQPYEQKMYKLNSVLGGVDACQEDVENFPRRIVVCDSPATGIRAIVLICEDGGQEMPTRQAIRVLQPNLVFNPVMAGALHENRSFVRNADGLARDPQTIVLIANSAVLPRSEDPRPRAKPPVGVIAFPLLATSSHKTYEILRHVRKIGPARTEIVLFSCPPAGT